MALTISGPLVIASSTGQPTVRPFGELKECVASVVNGQNQPAIKELAGKWIIKGIDDINMRHLFRFGSKASADVPLVSGQRAYSLASDFFAVREVQLIESSEVARTLEYIPWGQFNQVEERQDRDGAPAWWTSKNSFDDGTIEVYPVPDDSAAAKYSLRITYFERIQAPSADSDVIDAPRELGDVLCTYGEYGVLFTRDRTNPAGWGHKWRQYKDKLNAFMRSTEREPTEVPQFRVMWVDSDPNNEIAPLR